MHAPFEPVHPADSPVHGRATSHSLPQVPPNRVQDSTNLGNFFLAVLARPEPQIHSTRFDRFGKSTLARIQQTLPNSAQRNHFDSLVTSSQVQKCQQIRLSSEFPQPAKLLQIGATSAFFFVAGLFPFGLGSSL